MKNNIPGKMLVQIEDELMQAGDKNHISYARLSALMHEGIGCDELARAIDLAWRMPVCEIVDFIVEYDNSSPKMDELKFVANVGAKYHVSHDDVICRIQSVRKIQRYLKEHEENVCKYKKIKNNTKTITKRIDFTVSIPVARAMLVGYGYLQRVVDDMSDDEVVLAVLGRAEQYGATFRVIE